MATVADAALETRETIPLQKNKRTQSWCNCNEEYLSGSKFINLSFGTLTVIITAALLLQIYYGDYQVVPHGSVATDSLECSKIGTAILKKGGNSIDATIASSLCLAVVAPHLTSLDGDGLMLIYNHRSRGKPDVINFENGNSNAEHLLPRLVLGLAFVHQHYSSLSWKELVEPAADLAKKGFLIPKMLVQAVKEAKVGDLYRRLEPGQLLHLDSLSTTLQQIAEIPEKELYAFITPQNEPITSQALKGSFSGYDIYVPDGPTAGASFLKNLDEIATHNFTQRDSLNPEYLYRIAEITQNTYNAFNLTPSYHEGTSTNVAAMDLNDNYVSFTTGLFAFFGTGELTTRGYFLDVRQRGPRMHLPLIATDASAICGRRVVLAANDLALATQILTALLIGRQDVTTAVEAARFHILNNGSVGIEASHSPHFTDDVLKYLETLTDRPVLEDEPFMSSNIVEKIKDELNSHSDSRGGGIASRF